MRLTADGEERIRRLSELHVQELQRLGSLLPITGEQQGGLAADTPG